MVSHFYSASGGTHVQTTLRINIPIEHYEGLLVRCEAWRGEYDVLKNRAIVCDAEDRSSMVITCEALQATMLLELASGVYPAAAPHIEESIHLAKRSDGRLVKFRDHPLISYRGTPSWPPVWSKAGKDGNKTVTGEVGILRQVNHNAKLSKRCYLVIEWEGVRYLGILLFDNTAFSAVISTLLKSHIGRSIKGIAELDLPSTL
jgi:hypothetical protein